MAFQKLLPAVALLAIANVNAQGLDRAAPAPDVSVQATCTQQSGERQLARVNPHTIEVRSGSATRTVDLAQIQSIDVTGPVNRNNRVAWATVKTTSGEERNVALVLPTSDHTLLLEGVGAQGSPDSIDVLSCNHLTFRKGA